VIGERQQVLVTVSSGDAEGWSAHLHVRAFDESFVDRVAQVDVSVAVGSHVADGGESGFECDLRVARSDEGALGDARRKLMIGIKVGVHREVCMDVDEAGQQCERAQIDLGIAGLFRRRHSRRDRGDAVAGYDNGLVGSFVSGVYIEDVAGSNEGSR
jgi:hypothetical protein